MTFLSLYNTNKPVFTYVYVHINEDVPVHISSWSCFYTLISIYLYTPALVHVPDYVLKPKHTLTSKYALKPNHEPSPSPIYSPESASVTAPTSTPLHTPTHNSDIYNHNYIDMLLSTTSIIPINYLL